MVNKQFHSTNFVFAKFEIIGTEAAKNKKTLNSLANTVRNIVDRESKHASVVNLLLPCPAELCFAVG